jgi:hypothetical protein
MNPKEMKRFREALEDNGSPRGKPKAQRSAIDPRPDTVDPRVKSSGHGNKTADKWNQ